MYVDMQFNSDNYLFTSTTIHIHISALLAECGALLNVHVLCFDKDNTLVYNNMLLWLKKS